MSGLLTLEQIRLAARLERQLQGADTATRNIRRMYEMRSSLELIADIAEGSRSRNSLQNIARIARKALK